MARLFEHLSNTGLIDEQELEQLQSGVQPDKMDDDAGGLLIRMVQQGTLTDYQAACLREDHLEELVLGEYLIRRPVGKGGMAEVFEAVRTTDGELFALKVLNRDAAQRKESAVRFDREVQAAAKLSHPNIVVAFDSKSVGDINFLVMEFVDGPNLADYVEKNGPLPVDEAIHYICQAACGLAHAHEQRIVHRDIKPHNLLLSSDGTVKILDMGLVRFDNAPKLGRRVDSADRLTQMGVMLGTADYMAPEQSNDPRNATYQSDIYSLGCTLYFLLTGNGPYDRDTAMATMLAHQTDPIPDIRWARTDVPESLQRIFELMVAKEMRDRYQSMHDLINDLEIFMQDPSGASVFTETGTGSGIGSSGIHDEAPVNTAFSPEALKEQMSWLPKLFGKIGSPFAMRLTGFLVGSVGGAVVGLMSWINEDQYANELLEMVGSVSSPLAANAPVALACYGAVVGAMLGLIVGEVLANTKRPQRS